MFCQVSSDELGEPPRYSSTYQNPVFPYKIRPCAVACMPQGCKKIPTYYFIQAPHISALKQYIDMPQNLRTTRAQALTTANDDDDASTTPTPLSAPSSPVSSTISTPTSFNSRDFDDLSIANADSYHQVRKPQKRRNRDIEDDALWKEALQQPPEGLPTRGNHNQRIWYCKRCNKACLSNNHAKSHLVKHGIVLPNGPKKPRVAQQSDTLRAALRIQQLKSEAGQRHEIDTEAWLNTLILMVVNHNLPHTLLEWPEFYLLMQLTNPDVVTKQGPMRASRWSIKQLLFAAYQRHQKTIITKLQSAISKLHFTTDIWTSPNKSHYQSITCHFVDESSRLLQLTLALREHTTEGHGAEEQSIVFLKVLEEYGISKTQVGYITSKYGFDRSRSRLHTNLYE